MSALTLFLLGAAFACLCLAVLIWLASRAPYDPNDGPWEDVRPVRRSVVPRVDLHA